MKQLLTVFFVFSCLLAQAQKKTENLIGTWELAQVTYNDRTATAEQAGFKRYKVVTPTNFVVIDIDPKTNVTRTSIFGTYTYTGGKYTEKILNVSREASNMIGSENTFEITFDGTDKMAQVGGFNGMKTDEKWHRVKTMAEARP